MKGHSWASKAGENPVYKVSLKSSDGHTLVLFGDSKALLEGFPKGECVDAKIGKAQTTLDA